MLIIFLNSINWLIFYKVDTLFFLWGMNGILKYVYNVDARVFMLQVGHDWRHIPLVLITAGSLQRNHAALSRFEKVKQGLQKIASLLSFLVIFWI